ncbi:MAG: chromate transporter [Clostridiales bacterium]|nr:chromate transporter [Clostridiales bacterium]
MKELWELFSVFFRIGAFTFGGGYAMLPIIQREVVEKRGWASDEEVIDYYAIGQSTPGIIAVNTATFIGYKKKGLIGAIFATLGMISPSLVIITIIASSFMHFKDNQTVQHAFAGIRVAVVALVVNAVVRMWKKSVKDLVGIILFILAFLVIAFTRISPIIIIFVSAATGILLSYRGAVKE